MSCTCDEQWKSLTWTRNGPTPHHAGCPDGKVIAPLNRTEADLRRSVRMALLERVSCLLKTGAMDETVSQLLTAYGAVRE
jgi:hypothetical protein